MKQIILSVFFLANIAQSVDCPPKPTLTLTATEWQNCGDTNLPEFECRTVTVPRIYDGKTYAKGEGTLNLKERRLKKGTPNKYIFLSSGGPGGNALILAYAVVPQIKTAFPDGNYEIRILSQRGTPDTDRIQDYTEFPNDLKSRIESSPYPPQAYTTTNAAYDVITTVKEAKSKCSTCTLHIIGESYGTQRIQRILQIEPDLFDTVIFDGSIDPQKSSNQFLGQQGNFANFTSLIYENCLKSDFCRKRTLPLSELVAFVDQLETGKSNVCADKLVSLVSPGSPAGQVIASLFSTIAMVANADVPVSLLKENPADPSVGQQFLNELITSFTSNVLKDGYLHLDFRVYAWTLLNQLAQCTTEEAFLKSTGVLLQIIGITAQIFPYTINPSSPLGNAYVSQILELLSEGSIAIDPNEIKKLQKQSVFRSPESSFINYQYLVGNATGLGATPDCYVGKSATNVKAKVVVLSGLLDPNTPITDNLNFNKGLGMAPGSNKVMFIHNNAGHQVISIGWSKCCSLLIRGLVGNDEASMKNYQICLERENSRQLFWEASDIKYLLGVDIWEGISSKKPQQTEIETVQDQKLLSLLFYSSFLSFLYF